MWAIGILGDVLGWIPGLHMLVDIGVAIGWIFAEDEKGNLYSGGRAALTIVVWGLETILGWVGLGFLPFFTLRLMLKNMM